MITVHAAKAFHAFAFGIEKAEKFTSPISLHSKRLVRLGPRENRDLLVTGQLLRLGASRAVGKTYISPISQHGKRSAFPGRGKNVQFPPIAALLKSRAGICWNCTTSCSATGEMYVKRLMAQAGKRSFPP